MRWGNGWEVSLNREIDEQRRAHLLAQFAPRAASNPIDQVRRAYLQKRCTCGSGLADGLCANCWPQ